MLTKAILKIWLLSVVNFEKFTSINLWTDHVTALQTLDSDWSIHGLKNNTRLIRFVNPTKKKSVR